MSPNLVQKFTAYLILAAALCLVTARGYGEEPAAHSSIAPGKVVEQATGRIMELVKEAPEYFDESPERYFAAIGSELDQVVDFRGFARGVMGDYASSQRYRTLDEAGRDLLRDQLDRFTSVLRESLIKTYSRGLLAFGGSEVELERTEVAPNNPRVASVTQKVFSAEGQVYTVKYQMGQYRDGHWALRNMIIENINLGEIYRGQFEAAADEFGGDLDAVIANWDEGAAQGDQREVSRGSK